MLHLLQEAEDVLEVVDDEINHRLAFFGRQHRVVSGAGFVAGRVG